MNGAADEKSPGTSTEPSWMLVAPSTLAEFGLVVTRAPAARSISSVWSRVGAGSITVVLPSAPRPASRIADLTCALATGSA